MKPMDDPCLSRPAVAPAAAEFERLVARPADPDADAAAAPPSPLPRAAPGAAVVARFEGFDLLDHPLVGNVAECPGERLVARSTVALRRAHVGRPVVLLFENGEPRLPLIVGVIEDPFMLLEVARPATVVADGERQIIEAEREIVLRCGEASITLTRAGKVVIQGRYVLSRSSGINRIKGAAVDIN